MCKRNNDGLEKFNPPEDYLISYVETDEEGYEIGESDPTQLSVWLDKNPTEFTFRIFIDGDQVKWDRGRKTGTVKKVIKARWDYEYEVESPEDGTVLIKQSQILPYNIKTTGSIRP
jgi:hypothetical protein